MHNESTQFGSKRYAGPRTILLQNTPDALFKPLQLERTMLLVMLPLFSLACVLVFIANEVLGTSTWFERYQMLPSAFVFAGLWHWALKTRPSRIARVRLATLIVGPGIVMERFAAGLLMTFLYGYDPFWLGSMSPWIILSACLYVFMIPGKRSFCFGFCYYLLHALLIAVFLIANQNPLPEVAIQDLLISHLVATPIFLVLTAGFSRLRMAYGTAMTKAEDFESLAMQDGLTGLFNRRAFAASMRRARSRQARKKTPVSLIMLDIDHFKRVNDTWGHDRGDEVLVKFTEILTATMRRTDDIIRWGGEEFMILMEETSLEKAGEVAERLRQLIESTDINHGHRVTSSFGVTELVPGEDDTEFFNRVDAALYDAKDMGRNRVVLRKKRKHPSNPNVTPIAELIEDSNFVVA
ncbi:MAG: GGDEF domain-containing protein [Planctomycetes bacterium]|nr:GGDEF domain-containing protein [Planctomycetota bacterium]